MRATPECLPPISGPPPPEGLLLWDGGCGFCAKSVALLQKIARKRVPERPVQTYLDRLGPEAVRSARDQVLWVDPDGNVSGGVVAVAHALRAAGRPSLAALLGLPMVRPAAAMVYRLIARNRHRMGGSGGACKPPL